MPRHSCKQLQTTTVPLQILLTSSLVLSKMTLRLWYKNTEFKILNSQTTFPITMSWTVLYISSAIYLVICPKCRDVRNRFFFNFGSVSVHFFFLNSDLVRNNFGSVKKRSSVYCVFNSRVVKLQQILQLQWTMSLTTTATSMWRNCILKSIR